MKLKISVAAIIISTAGIIGLITLVVNKTSRTDAPPTLSIKDNETIDAKQSDDPPAGLARERNKAPKASEPDEDDFEESDSELDNDPEPEPTLLSEDDRKRISEVASLSETELTRELDALKTRIEEEDLFDLLEAGDLPADKKTEAKEVLERFALLGLEGTRRKYMNVEPELKDPFYAHRESLKEIRELLSDD